MKTLQRIKVASVPTPPAAIVDAAAFTTAAIDTKGLSELLILAIFGAIDVNVASASIRESDSSDMSNPTTIATGGTDFALGTAAGSDNDVHGFHIDLKGRKRYIDFEITGGDGSAGTYLSVIALGVPQDMPKDATTRGLEVYANV